MSNEPGDRLHGHGDSVTVKNSMGMTIEAGYFIEVSGATESGHPEVAMADADSKDTLLGITMDDIEPGDTGTVHVRGVVLAEVENSVAAGERLRPGSSSAGEEAGLAFPAADDEYYGAYALDGKDSDTAGEQVVPVVLR